MRQLTSTATGAGLLGAALAFLLGAFFLLVPLGRLLINLSYDSAFLFRRDVVVRDAVLIYMDEESHLRLNQEKWQRWDRGLHARLLDRLTQAGARVVAFDILFSSTTNNPAADAEFVRAVKRHGSVSAAAMVVPDIYEGQVISWKLETPFPELKAAAAWGVVEVASTDAFVRRHYYRKDLNAPSLAWRTAQLASAKQLPPPFAERWINYYGPPGMLPHYSYWEALNGPGSAVFSNKVVFVGSLYHIGMTGGKGTDDFRTPYSRWTGTKAPGVEINATACLNVLRGDWLRRTSVSAELGLLALCGAVFGGLLSRLNATQAVGAGLLGAIVVGVLANVLVWRIALWFPWLIVSCVQVPCAAAWAVLIHARRLAREKGRLEQELALSRADEIYAQLGAASPSTPPSPRPSPGVAMPRADATAPTIIGATTELFGIPDHTLVRRIGSGAYGDVWLARAIIGTYHAAKIVHRRNFASAGPFEREFNGLKKFTPISMGHPGLVKVLHVGRNEKAEYLYCVMELADDEVSGQSIDPETYSPKTLAKELKKSNGLPPAECVRICLQLADALAYLHDQGLIHRDIKASNVIFAQGLPKLADIGLVTKAATKSGDVSYLGTEGYIPPEGPGTPLADIYSFGKLMYEVATGLEVSRFPEPATGLARAEPDPLLIALNQIMLTACAPAPHKRYQSAHQLRTALAAIEPDAKRRPG